MPLAVGEPPQGVRQPGDSREEGQEGVDEQPLPAGKEAKAEGGAEAGQPGFLTADRWESVQVPGDAGRPASRRPQA